LRSNSNNNLILRFIIINSSWRNSFIFRIRNGRRRTILVFFNLRLLLLSSSLLDPLFFLLAALLNVNRKIEEIKIRFF